MNNDSDHLIDLIFGSEIGVFTEKEKEYIHNLFVDHKIVNYSNDKMSKNKSNLQIIKHERPDLLLIYENTVFAIEHFKIDSSKTTRKGSTYKQKYNENYYAKQQNRVNEKLKNDKMVWCTEKIDTKLQYSNLYTNLINNFDDHYDNISEYDKNIRTIDSLKLSKIEYIFYVEYDLIFPSFFINEENKVNVIYPHNDIAFINFIKDKNKLSGIMFHFNSGTKSIPDVNQFIMIKDNNLLDYKVNNIYVFDTEKIEIHDFEKPMMSSASFLISKSI